jgi:hypothetical protein
VPGALKQASFVSGELAPSLHARVDLQRYIAGLKTCRNWIVLASGGVTNRAGTRFLYETPSSAAARLIPFVFSAAPSQSYVLEFTAGKIRFYQRDATTGEYGIVLRAGAPYEVATAYTAADLPNLRYAQSADVLTLVDGVHQPAELKRFAHTTWTLTNYVVGEGRPATPQNATIAVAQMAEDALQDATHTLEDWGWVVTAVARGQESLPSLPALNVRTCLYPDRPAKKITWDAVAGADGYSIYRKIGFHIGSVGYGFVGYSKTNEFWDKGVAPDYSVAPPFAENPFSGAGLYPSLVTYFQNRIVFAAATNEPQTIRASKTGNYKNFDRSIPTQDDDALEFTIASQQVDTLRALVSGRRLLALGLASAYAIGPEDGSALTPTTVSANPHEQHGSAALPVLTIGNVALYVTSMGGAVRELFFDYSTDGYASNDLSILASHLFEGYSIVDWAYSAEPFRALWAVRSDGTLLCLTYQREQEVWAWSRHDTDGAFESVCVIPEGNEHGVYVVVRRTIGGSTKRYVERLMPRARLTDARSGVFVDSSASYDGRNTTAGLYLKLTGGTTWAAGDTPFAQASGVGGVSPNIFTPQDVGNVLVFTGVNAAGEIAPPVRGEIIAYVDATRVQVRVSRDVPESLRDVTTPYWEKARRTFSGLAHLEGKTVAILADGGVVSGGAVVAGGQITLQDAAAVVHAGLPYTSELINLPLAAEGLSRSAEKIVSEVTLEVDRTRGLYVGQAGGDRDSREVSYQATQARQRVVADSYGVLPLVTGRIKVKPQTAWSQDGQIRVEQRDPLPATVLSLIPKVQVGG